MRPDSGDPQREQRLHLGAVSHERADQVERHASQVRDQPEDRNEQVLQRAELRMVVDKPPCR